MVFKLEKLEIQHFKQFENRSWNEGDMVNWSSKCRRAPIQRYMSTQALHERLSALLSAQSCIQHSKAPSSALGGSNGYCRVLVVFYGVYNAPNLNFCCRFDLVILDIENPSFKVINFATGSQNEGHGKILLFSCLLLCFYLLIT